MNPNPPRILSIFGLLILICSFASGAAQATGYESSEPSASALDSAAKKNTVKFMGFSENRPIGCDVDTQDYFPSGMVKIFATFDYTESGLSAGDEAEATWFLDNEAISKAIHEITEETECIWDGLSKKNNKPLDDGNYRIELKMGKTTLTEGEIEIGGEPPKKEKQRESRHQIAIWSDNLDANNCPLNEVDSYPSDTMEIIAAFPDAQKDLEKGEKYKVFWLYDGEVNAQNTRPYKGTPCYNFSLNNGDDSLPDGTFGFKATHNKETIAEIEVVVGGKKKKGADEGVTLQGTLKNADNGKAIKGGSISLLVPDVDIDDWIENDMPENDVYSMAESDKKGVWLMEDPLERGETYPIVTAKKGYRVATGEVEVSKKADDVIEMDIELEEK